jgi:hypothetical protein
MNGNRSTGAGPIIWIVVGIFAIFGLLPALARGGGGTFTLLIVGIILWVGWRVMRAAVQAGDVAPPDGPRQAPPLPPPAQEPAAMPEAAPDEEPDIAALQARLAELESLRDRGSIDAAEYEARRAAVFRES